jgi:hypothetical protein
LSVVAQWGAPKERRLLWKILEKFASLEIVSGVSENHVRTVRLVLLQIDRKRFFFAEAIILAKFL